MKKYLQIPSLQAWHMYYEYMYNNLTYYQIGHKYGVTGERIRQLVNKVKRYLIYGNTRILTREQVLEEVKKIKLF